MLIAPHAHKGLKIPIYCRLSLISSYGPYNIRDLGNLHSQRGSRNKDNRINFVFFILQSNMHILQTQN